MIPNNRGIDKYLSVCETYNTMKQAKAMTIRLSADQAEQLETVASVEGKPVSEVIRAAISDHIQERKKDKNFQDGLKNRIVREQKFLKN